LIYGTHKAARVKSLGLEHIKKKEAQLKNEIEILKKENALLKQQLEKVKLSLGENEFGEFPFFSQITLFISKKTFIKICFIFLEFFFGYVILV
jgi:hypothetical protein